MSVPDRCSHGHRLTDKTLYIDTRGYWRCRACRAFFMKESRKKLSWLKSRSIVENPFNLSIFAPNRAHASKISISKTRQEIE